MLALVPTAAAIAVAGCGGSSGTTSSSTASNPPATTPATTATSASATLTLGPTTHGQALVGSQGRSLYLFEKDTATTSTCSGACAGIWPPLVVSVAATPGNGIVAAKLGTTKRADGQTQVTYNGHPLYYYAGDTAAGQTAGEGLNSFGAGWDLVSASGKKIESGG